MTKRRKDTDLDLVRCSDTGAIKDKQDCHWRGGHWYEKRHSGYKIDRCDFMVFLLGLWAATMLHELYAHALILGIGLYYWAVWELSALWTAKNYKRNKLR